MPRANPPRPRAVNPEPPEVVEPRWILKAAGAVIAVGLLCSYVTLCLFFYFGQWQLVLRPSRKVAATPASQHLAFTPIRFGDDVSGQPQLAGWWIPGDAPDDPTVVVLHSENGSMSNALPAAKALHDARLNVLLFDYRGYGESGGGHPTQALMQEDASAAFNYAQKTQPANRGGVLVYGEGLGASLAVTLATAQPTCRGIILVGADGDTFSRVDRDQRSRIVPLGLLFHERFPLADPLSRLRTPKLLVSYTRTSPPLDAQRAADPKLTVELPPEAGPSAITASVRRFLDIYVAHPPGTLTPSR